jgi:hypothetical protein
LNRHIIAGELDSLAPSCRWYVVKSCFFDFHDLSLSFH